MEWIVWTLEKAFIMVGPFVLLLGLLIFVHELGHFLVARLCGVRVETFSLGFGKKMLQFKKGDTTYALSLIPLGGYVKMFGDEMGKELSPEEQKYSFLHKSVWQRIAIVLAGPLMNFFFAILVFALVATMGEDQRAAHVGDIASDSRAFASGFRSGDLILKVENEDVLSLRSFEELLTKRTHLPTKIEVRRENGDTESLVVEPGLAPNPNIFALQKNIGSIEGLSYESKTPLIGVSLPNSVAYQAGLRTGDIITHINGEEIKYWRELETKLVGLANKTLEVKVLKTSLLEKESQDHTEAELKAAEAKIELSLPEANISLLELGIEPPELFLYKVIKNSPADLAGFKKYDKIVKINSQTLNNWDELLNQVKSFNEETKFLKFEILRNGQPLSIEVVPEKNLAMNSTGLQETRYTVGIVPLIGSSRFEPIKVQYKGLDSLYRGVEKTWDISLMTLMSFVKLFKAEISPRNISGVISIGQAASETFKIGISQFLTMMGIISVNLFILNLLPIPVLDGGHLVFYTIEALKGSPLSLKKMELAQRFGFAVLMSLMFFALFNDFTRIFSNW